MIPPDFSEVEIAQTTRGIELPVKVVPGASRSRVVGPWKGALKVTVSAPPEGGKANAALVGLLASLLGVGKSDISLVAGHTRTVKRVAVTGLTADQVRRRLAGR